MAQLIAKRVLISPLINKDLPVRHPSPRSWQFCVRDPESPKVTKTHNVLTWFGHSLLKGEAVRTEEHSSGWMIDKGGAYCGRRTVLPPDLYAPPLS
jgi:hypothetical protein